MAGGPSELFAPSCCCDDLALTGWTSSLVAGAANFASCPLLAALPMDALPASDPSLCTGRTAADLPAEMPAAADCGCGCAAGAAPAATPPTAAVVGGAAAGAAAGAAPGTGATGVEGLRGGWPSTAPRAAAAMRLVTALAPGPASPLKSMEGR